MEGKRNVVVAVVETRVVMCTVGDEAEKDPNKHTDDDVMSMMVLFFRWSASGARNPKRLESA